MSKLSRHCHLFIAGMALLFAGCMASGPWFNGLSQLQNDEAQIYLYRPNVVYGSGHYPIVLLDGNEAGSLHNGGYLMFTVKPGEHLLTLKGKVTRGQWFHKEFSCSISALAGKRYFFKLLTADIISLKNTPEDYNAVAHDGELLQITESKAVREMWQLRLSE